MRNRKEIQGAAHMNAEVEMEPGGHKPRNVLGPPEAGTRASRERERAVALLIP